jgi:hypothetical protein
MKCKTCGHEIKERKTIIINKVEYELEQHDNGKVLSEITIPKGWRLLLPSEAVMLYERGLINNSFWFFVQQTNKEEQEKGNVARFGAGSDGANFICGGYPSLSYASLGILLCKTLGDEKL